ncbi:MAG: hypothetical protein IBX72_07390 [Nitrospirae bacterium]|nr:hypothetical protein [Nitrospirota bacterium]
MLNIHRIEKLFRKAFIPVTIMLIPHGKDKPLNLKLPFIGIFSAILFCISGIVYTFSIAVNTFEYYRMKDKLNYYTQQFIELNSTISALKEAEIEFKRLFSLGSKEKILENVVTSDSGSIDIDMENIRQEIKKTTETVGGNKRLFEHTKGYLSGNS